MKWTHFFLLLFLIPSLVYAYLPQDRCNIICNQAVREENQCAAFIERYKKLGPDKEEARAQALNKAIGCCSQAIAHYDTILNDIAQQSRDHRHNEWCPQMKTHCENNKNRLTPVLNDLKDALNKTLSSMAAFQKVKALHEESAKKASLASTQYQNCPPRRLDNVDVIVAALNEIANIYEAAAAKEREALDILHAAPLVQEENKVVIQQAIDHYQAAANKYRKEAADWPGAVATQKTVLKERFATLKEDKRLFEEKGLKRSSYEVQKQMMLILEQLIENDSVDERDVLKEELTQVKKSILNFETEADSRRLTEAAPSLSPEDFKNREIERRRLFFKNNLLLNSELFLQSILHSSPRVLPLDGCVAKKGSNFALYTDQFYRFLVQNNTPVSQLIVEVYEKEVLIYEEKIALPSQSTLAWERYLTTDGLIFVPETKLKTEFGFDLRLNFVYDPKHNSSVIITQRGIYSNYQFSISLDEKDSLYTCHLAMPPPWQLGTLRKPALPRADKPIGKTAFSKKVGLSEENDKESALIEPISYPTLDQFLEELKKDPLALASYVHHEIDLVDPFLHQEKGTFYPPSIHRNALRTYLEKKGSAWEQCQLLVYFLRKAGYPTYYAIGSVSSLQKAFFEKLLLCKLADEETEALVQYPYVVFFNGKEWITLFPWMKEIQIQEGYDLYNLMPEEYASADRWILRYLKGDENILKQIGPDGDDTAGILFVRFVEEELRKQGLSLSDVGLHRTRIKKQFSSWDDFPRPLAHTEAQLVTSLEHISGLFAKVSIELSSHENPNKKVCCTLPLAYFDSTVTSLRFSTQGSHQWRLHTQFGTEEGAPLDLGNSDHLIDVKVTYELSLGSTVSQTTKTLSIAKGTSAALCFHFGGANPELTSQFHEQFSQEKNEKNRLHALLAFIGAAYFEKCGRAEEILADLHKVNSTTALTFGLAKFSPDTSKGAFKGDEDLILPQVDMFWFYAQIPSQSGPIAWHQETQTAHRQLKTLLTVDQSSNEHQILREIFNKPAVSTVKLLQLAHIEQEKKGLSGEGFLVLTPTRVETVEKTPEIAKSLYFPQLKNLNLRGIKAASPGQWDAIKTLFDPEEPLNNWAYAYMTPGLTSSQDGSYQEMGTLAFHPVTFYALISNNNLISHGGLGSPLPSNYLAPSAIKGWQLVSSHNSSIPSSFTLQVPSSPTLSANPTISSSVPFLFRGTSQWSPDVRSEHKSDLNQVGDPVDIISGAFYIDEVDLFLPGPFPLQIRRNYNSQNPLIGDFGVGWKLSLNPYLIKQDGKLLAAEEDGTVIAYRYNRVTSRWEVFPEDNPDLCNFNQKGIGSTANPFHAYIEDDVLYGSDGSQRIFEDGLLKKWINSKGSALIFFYNKEGKLSRIESSNGDFCGLRYNHDGNISEIYAKDGRRITYDYDWRKDLVKVTLPNTAKIKYDYDHSHRIIRETRPHGKVLENIYKEGKVQEQRSPMGPQQQMVVTATFDYQGGLTTVTDAAGGKTTYKIFQKQIYKIIDPLGYETLQSWFIDEKSWFDPIKEKIIKGNQSVGAARCLKSSTDKRGLTTYYRYDSRGNPIEMGLQGKDLTGNGESLITKKFAYNDRDLCIQEEVLGQKTITSYDTTFPYLPKRVETYSGNTLISYVDLEYNSMGQIEKEDQSGSITLWKYDSRGLPRQKTQLTGTDDSDVVTTYAYNNQGQCIEIRSIDTIQENVYDIMGSPIESKTFCLSGTLLSATYIGYDLNNQPIWKQAANPNNTLYLDYHASGLIKALRHTLSPAKAVAYTLYEYDPCGYLIEEVDPLGYTTYRDYDALGRVKSETKEGHSTLFTYESGGLLETVTTPSGAKTTRFYTTNGLLKEEIYPDGTKSSVIYDFLGRPIRETKNGITWEITYDDSHHQVTRTNIATKASEIREFDMRGNLIRFTDAAGYTSEKTYDSLNRLKTETSPSGEQIVWNYQGDTVTCTLPTGEKRAQRYEGGRVAESEAVNAQGQLLANSSYHYDPETDIQEVIQGEEVTTTWMNTRGLPIKAQKGNIITTYEYDLCGSCIAVTDGDGRTTRQTFDGLRRITQKELPDGGLIGYTYDLDSNITEYHLPNSTIWKASYDSMRRKTAEELQAGRQSSLRWEYTYENGYLKAAQDPMQRIHTYFYDLSGRLAQETVDGWERHFTYDPRGLLSCAEQIGSQSISWLSSWFYSPHPEYSKVERSYDADGRLILETIYLNSTLIQQTRQAWKSSSRSLQIDGHTREFIYQNNQLTQVSTREIDLSYSYNLSGSLQQKSTPYSTTTIDYNSSGLPENIHTRLPDQQYPEALEWYPSGKLAAYASPSGQKSLTYTAQGYLQAAGAEKYDFDFGTPGIGVRTAAPGWTVPQNGVDAFGKVLTEVDDKNSLTTSYNLMGQVVSQGSRQFEWDPWGRLLRIADGVLTWEASYDAFGRRLQTRYTPGGNSTLTTTSFYDPEKEFQEIGVKYGGKTFWKIYGPSSCDAVTDETGATVVLMHNALDQLTGVVSQQGTIYTEQLPSSYGPQSAPVIPQDLLSYAQSLMWHSQAQDPTGLIWMGARYYDPKGGRFLSPDPIGYPVCLDLYAYAGGDPVNYLDPDGRFKSAVYQAVRSKTINDYQGARRFTNALHKIDTFFSSKSISYEVGYMDLPKGGIGFVNGIDNTFEESKASALRISSYSGGAKIQGIYNATNGKALDALNCALGCLGFKSPVVKLIKNRWNHFIATHGPEEKFLEIGHSGGTIEIFNALLDSPKEVRDRIIVLSIAPGKIIPKKLCYRSFNYASKNDFVPKLDIFGRALYGHELMLLEPHKDAPNPDHTINSPTYDDIISTITQNYLDGDY